MGLYDKSKAEMYNILALEVIEPVEQETDWYSGLTIAPKPNSAIRMCVDLTHLNIGVQRKTYLFPRVSVMLSKSGFSVKGRVTASQKYHKFIVFQAMGSFFMLHETLLNT